MLNVSMINEESKMKPYNPLLSLIPLCIVFTGCAINKPKEIYQLSMIELCDFASQQIVYENVQSNLISALLIPVHSTPYKLNEIQQEIQSRDFFTTEELDLINTKKIKIGVREEVLHCSWGKPKDVNKTVGTWGIRKQYVYGGGQYVYTRDGVIESWQD